MSKIGRLDPVRINPTTGTHVIDETLITTSSSAPTAMLTIPDGTIWFAIEVNHLEHFKPNLDGTVGPLPPMVALTAGSPSQSTGVGGQVYSTSTPFTIAATRPDQCLDGVRYRIYATGTTPGDIGPLSVPPISFRLGNGSWIVEFYGTGPGGQSLTQSTMLFVDDSRFAADTTPPVLWLPADISIQATSSSGAVVPYTVTARDLIDPAPVVSCTPRPGSLFPIGTTTVSCTAMDRTGNVAPGSFTVTVTAGPPSVTVPPNIVVPATGATTVVSFSASALSPWGGYLPVTCSPLGVTGPSPATFTFAFRSDVSTTVTCTSAADGLGHSGSPSSFVVTPITPPVLHLPPSTTVIATGTSTTVTYAATATTGTGAALAITCTPASGTAFAPGTTVVTCSASDRGIRTIGSFAISVLDLPPVLPTQFVIWGGNDGGVQVNQRVVFWGEGWWKQVDLAQRSKIRSFKGWAATVEGTTWSTKGGNSKPPETLSEYIRVVITTSIERPDGADQAKVRGNVAGHAILRVDSPYKSEPGSPVYGVVVAILSSP